MCELSLRVSLHFPSLLLSEPQAIARDGFHSSVTSPLCLRGVSGHLSEVLPCVIPCVFHDNNNKIKPPKAGVSACAFHPSTEEGWPWGQGQLFFNHVNQGYIARPRLRTSAITKPWLKMNWENWLRGDEMALPCQKPDSLPNCQCLPLCLEWKTG